jgi:hypothetical protein
VPRKKEYKKGVDADDARRKREDNIIELRKNKRDENLQKKRMVNAGPSYAMEDSSARTSLVLQNKVRAWTRGQALLGACGAFKRCNIMIGHQLTRLLVAGCPDRSNWTSCPPRCRACTARTPRSSMKPHSGSASCFPLVSTESVF